MNTEQPTIDGILDELLPTDLKQPNGEWMNLDNQVTILESAKHQLLDLLLSLPELQEFMGGTQHPHADCEKAYKDEAVVYVRQALTRAIVGEEQVK